MDISTHLLGSQGNSFYLSDEAGCSLTEPVSRSYQVNGTRVSPGLWVQRLLFTGWSHALFPAPARSY